MDNFIIPRLDPKTSFEITSKTTKKMNVNDTSLNEAADRFEALFLSQMLKSARAAKLSEDVLGNDATETYYAMMDNELAEKLSKAGNFGIAEALIRQFGKNVEVKDK
jgi:flagellar protein FlgJ